MPKRIVAQTVIIQREGVAVKPAVGSTFDFTAKEIEQLDRLNPEALQKPISKDEATASTDGTITLTQAQLDAQIQAAVEKDRGLMEQQLRTQIEEEMKTTQTEEDGKTSTAKTSAKKKASDDDI